MSVNQFLVAALGCLMVLGPDIGSAVSRSVSGERPSRVDVRIVADEAEAVLAILDRRKAGQSPRDADWQRLFSSEGYVRLKKREAAMDRAFSDEDFKAFVLLGSLAERAQLLKETLADWRRASVDRAARRALAYLPDGAQIKAKIYPVIKPLENSFVFDISNDPAIFLYLDPSINREQFENTLAHELHHIGYGSACYSTQTQETSKPPKNVQSVIEWTGAFGEGFAMLAAAGGPDIHPHAFSKAEDRSRWDRDLANLKQDLERVEEFFFDLLRDRFTEEEQRKKGFSFFGIQGPWYTLGWKMSVTIEKDSGRATLIQSMCDRKRLLSTYNAAAARQNRVGGELLPLWSPLLIEALEGGTR